MKKRLAALVMAFACAAAVFTVTRMKAEAKIYTDVDEYIDSYGIYYTYLNTDNDINTYDSLRPSYTGTKVVGGTIGGKAYTCDHPGKYVDPWMDKNEVKNRRHQTLQAAAQIVAGATGSDHEKVKYLHDRLCEKTVYSLEGNYEIEASIAKAYGALVNGKAKCVGYAEAFKLLCDFADIPCMYVSGKAHGVEHVWNIVKLEDGEWYEVDCTYDDTTDDKHNNIVYDWFLIPTADMNVDHVRDNDKIYLMNFCPTAYGTKFAYSKKEISVSDAKYTVTSLGGAEYKQCKSNKETVRIPDTILVNGREYEVTSIAKNAFKNNKKIKKIIVGKNIESIGENAFMKCKNLEHADLSKCKIKELNLNLFKGDGKLKKLYLNGGNITSVKKDALKKINPNCTITVKSFTGNKGSFKRMLKKQGAKKCRIKFK